MPEFNSLDAAAKQTLFEKLGNILKENGLEDIPISVSRELVFNASAQSFEENSSCAISKELTAADEEKAQKVSDELKAALEGTTGVKVSITAKLGAGDPYKTITKIQKCSEDGAVDLAHEGQVLLIDFWATWCPPCQTPMQHNVDMLAKRGEEWKDKARIIGLSIDQTKDAVNKHVADKKWESVEHFHRSESDCSKVYSVNGVPHVMLVDKEGKIAFKGHPANRKNLEQDIDDLIAGKALTGEGTGPAPVVEGEKAPAIPEGFEELDADVIGREVETNKLTLEGFAKDDSMKDAADKCPRAFCVIVLNQNYMPATGKSYTKYENYRVLVGPKEKIDGLKATFEEKMKGSFKTILREQAI